MNPDAKLFEDFKPRRNYGWIEATVAEHTELMSWSPDDIVLDIGCGQGRATRELLLPKCKKKSKILATDAFAEMVEYGDKNYPHERIEYKVQDFMADLPTEWKGKFGKVFSFFAFNYMRDFKELFTRIHDVLQPGGEFSFISVATDPAFKVYREIAASEKWSSYIKNVDNGVPPTQDWDDICEEFKKLAEQCNLEPIRVRLQYSENPYPDMKAYMSFFKSVLPSFIMSEIPVDKQEEFLDDCSKLVTKHGIKVMSDGQTIYVSNLLIVYGRRPEDK